MAMGAAWAETDRLRLPASSKLSTVRRWAALEARVADCMRERLRDTSFLLDSFSTSPASFILRSRSSFFCRAESTFACLDLAASKAFFCLSSRASTAHESVAVRRVCMYWLVGRRKGSLCTCEIGCVRSTGLQRLLLGGFLRCLRRQLLCSTPFLHLKFLLCPLLSL